MRCLFCGKQLAFLRRWTGGGEFCSDAHKQSYQQEYNKLALSRLLQAQSKPDTYRAPEPQHEDPDNAVGFPEHTKKIAARNPEQGWTTVKRANQKRLPAPVTKAALPAPSGRKEAPGKADFLVDKPQLQSPAGTEPPALGAFPVLGVPEPYRPRLSCRQADLHAALPPPRAELVELPSLPPFANLRRPPIAVEPALTRESHGTVRVGLALNTRPVAALSLAGLLPFENYPAAPAQPETELHSPYNFHFQIVVRGIPDPDTALGNPQENTEHCAAALERRLLDLLPLNNRPAPLQSPATRHHFEELPLRTFRPYLPANTTLPLRHAVSATDPKKVVSESARSSPTPKISVAEINSAGAATPVAVASEAERPGFLKEAAPIPSSSSVWGSVHKYLKNIVGCLLLATLGGDYYWHASVAKAPELAQAASELVGEADRAKPERDIFIYPASMLMQDYRVDFEVPVDGKESNWMFRVADPKNYYGMRLEPERDGAVLRWNLHKYVEIEGQQILSQTVRLPHTDQTDSWRITLEVQGSQFRTYVQGHLMDKWTDTRFSRGGFGSYGGRAEPLSIRSVRVGPLEPASSGSADPRD
ncbi:MAG: hypothetical protein M3Z32_01960 [Acidobacteriota bacterium]|nr:hypothetical protein [Acidobacteriota bacterium]